MFHIEREIQEQPEVIQRLIATQRPNAIRIAAAIHEFNPSFVMIAARGTSDNAARYAQYLMGIHAGLPVALAAPSIHTLYGAPPSMSRALVIGISQSGQSEDVRRVLEDANAQGALTLSITNAPESPLAQTTQHHLALECGEEVSVAATKTYTAELAAIALLTAALRPESGLEADLARLPEWVAETLTLSESLSQRAERYRYMERIATLGRGYNYATAFEIGLKIKELCSVTGEAYSEADFRHGPIAIIQSGFPVIVIAPKGEPLPLMLDLLARLGERQAECLVISNDADALNAAHIPMPIPDDVPEWLSPVCAVIPGQIFAKSLALVKGYPVDKPQGLTKVTNTR